MEAKITLQERISGGLIGMLVGDALGVPYEFHDQSSIPSLENIEYQLPSDFRRAHSGVPIGTYSDDGAQALILLDSLIKCGRFDANHFAIGLVSWYESGFMAVNGELFDCGVQTAKAISELQRGTEPLLAGGNDTYSNGNGSLMRVLPLALWANGTDIDLIADAFDQSTLTHRHLRSQLCCAIYCLWARGVMHDNPTPWEYALETFYKYFPKNSMEAIEFETNIIPPNGSYEVRGSGYVVDSLRAAKWLNENFDTFEGVVKNAVALGNDTDTTACIAGGIAGIKYGIDGIPKRWVNGLRGKEIYQPLLSDLLVFASR